jgi:hypothetical protein
MKVTVTSLGVERGKLQDWNDAGLEGVILEGGPAVGEIGRVGKAGQREFKGWQDKRAQVGKVREIGRGGEGQKDREVQDKRGRPAE